MDKQPSAAEEIVKWVGVIGTLILVLWLIVEFAPASVF